MLSAAKKDDSFIEALYRAHPLLHHGLSTFFFHSPHYGTATLEMAEAQPPNVVEGATTGDYEEEVPKAASAEDRKAAAALSSLDSRADESAGTKDVDQEAVRKAMERLGGGAAATNGTVAKLGDDKKVVKKAVKVDQADLALVVRLCNRSFLRTLEWIAVPLPKRLLGPDQWLLAAPMSRPLYPTPIPPSVIPTTLELLLLGSITLLCLAESYPSLPTLLPISHHFRIATKLRRTTS